MHLISFLLSIFFAVHINLFSSEVIGSKLLVLKNTLNDLTQKIGFLSAKKFTYPTFTSWKNVCDDLPYWHDAKKKVTNETPLALNEVYFALQQCANVFKSDFLTNKSLWLPTGSDKKNIFPESNFFDLDNNSPQRIYAQKLHLLPNSKVALHGDLHGDIHSLVGFLDDLKKQGYLNDDFKIADNFYLLFLGDYTDRGLYGVEVLYTIMRLKIANPSQCFMVRGNHEDIAINITYGFQGELKEKFAKEDTNKILQKIARFYDFLPVVIYLGSGLKNGNQYFFQCCHGGMELGYLPESLLGSGNMIAFEWITQLDRVKNFDRKKSLWPKALEQNLKNLQTNKREFEFDNLTNITTEKIQQLGFMWNDFIIDPIPLVRFQKGRGWQYGKDFTTALLKADTEVLGDKIELVGVLRAHQHSNSWDYSDTNMMPLIIDGITPGAGKLWEPYNNDLGADSVPYIQHNRLEQLFNELTKKDQDLVTTLRLIYVEHKNFMYGYRTLKAMYDMKKFQHYKEFYDKFYNNLSSKRANLQKLEANFSDAEKIKLKKYLEEINTAQFVSLWRGCVITFNVSPDTTYNDRIQYGFDTYGILNLADTFEQSSLLIKTKGNKKIAADVVQNTDRYQVSNNYWHYLISPKAAGVGQLMEDLSGYYNTVVSLLSKE